MPKIKTVLLATDMSELSRPAIEAGADLARKYGAKVVVGYVIEDRIPPLGMIEYSGINLAGIEEKHRETAEQHLQELTAELKQTGLSVEYELGLGIPHREIVDLAKRKAADVIVMGTHGRGFVSHAILGSTAERVLRHAPCPCYIVRDPKQDK